MNPLPGRKQDESCWSDWRSARLTKEEMKEDGMIDWSVSPIFVCADRQGWFFPSFKIQEFLLPLISIGEPIIDDYDDTVFTSADCARLIGNIDFVIGSGTFENRMCVRFDSLENGLTSLRCDEIKRCLLLLRDAADEDVRRGGALTFFGD